MSLLERAQSLARLAHHGQTRKASGKPFIKHPQDVVDLLQIHAASETARAAGWVHDVVEDTSYTFRDIRETCSHEVAKIVGEVTERKLDARGNKRPWKDRKTEVLAAVPELSQDALEVRAADVLANFIELLDDLDAFQQAGRDPNEVWSCFAVGKVDSIWYFRSMLTAIRARFEAGRYKGWVEQLDMVLFVIQTVFEEED